MFLSYLNPQQQATFLFLARKMSEADGILADAEVARLNVFKSQMPGIKEKECSIGELPSIFSTKLTRGATLLELAGLAMADEKIAPEEMDLLQEIAKVFSFDCGELDEIMSWVSRAFYLFREAQSFMEE